MGRSWTIATIRGIPIRLHISLLLLLPYIAIVVSSQFEVVAGLIGQDARTFVLPPLVWGVLLAIGVFVGVLLHELAHSFVALSSGAEVHSITLMMLGGVSRIVGDIRHPGREAWMAAAGPLTSLAIGVVFFFVHLLIPASWSDLSVAALIFAQINAVLGVFNLLPAFPMDGGRILRAALSPKLGRLRATRTAAGIGKGMAVLFGLLGLVSFNLILLLIAVFVFMGASVEASSLETRLSLRGVRMGNLMDRRLGEVSAETPLSEVAARFLDENVVAFLVRDGAGRPAALLTAGDLERADKSAIGKRAGDVARGDRPIVHEDDDATRVLALLQGGPRSVIVVLDGDDEPIGVISSADVSRAAMLQSLVEDTGGLRR